MAIYKYVIIVYSKPISIYEKWPSPTNQVDLGQVLLKIVPNNVHSKCLGKDIYYLVIVASHLDSLVGHVAKVCVGYG